MTDIEKSSTRKNEPNLRKDIAKGLTAGFITSIVFAPYDRAMYLAVCYNRFFLNLANFRKPYHGFQQVLVSRSLGNGMYYIMQGALNDYCYPYLHYQLQLSESSSQFWIGALAGSFSGILTNPLSTIKYYTWGDSTRTFKSSLTCMYTSGDLKPFMRGISSTILRDAMFGCIYEVLRHKIANDINDIEYEIPSTETKSFAANLIAASIGTIVTSPVNYARSIQYATPPKEPTPSMLDIWKVLRSEAKKYPYSSQLQFFSRKLQLGPGISRVALGATIAQSVVDNSDTAYKYCVKYLSGKSP